MKRLLILGSGQYGTVAKETAEAMGIFDEIAFLDDNSKAAVGKIEDIDKFEYDAAFIAIGNPEVREKLANRVGEKLFTLIHPKATIIRKSENGSYGNYEKLNDLLDRINLKNRIVDDAADISRLLDLEVDYSDTDEIIREERIHTNNYLRKILK